MRGVALISVLILAACSAALGQASITANATSFKNRDYVLVSYSNVTNPTAADAVAVVVEGTNLTLSVPLRYKWATDSPGYLTTGSGNVTFQLLNQRAGVNFLFFRNITQVGNFSQLELIGNSSVVAVENPNEPVQGHLALTANGPSYMLVQWQTRDEGSPEVKWGLTSGTYTNTVAGNTTQYTINDMCGYPANATGWIESGTTNTGLMSGLAPNTSYYYIFGDPSFGFSQEYSFVTGPVIGPNSSVAVLVNADPGHALRDGANEFEYDDNARLFNAPGSPAEIFSSIVNQLAGNGLQQGASLNMEKYMVGDSSGATLALFNGDLSYARGFGTQWDVHFDLFSNLATKMPVMVVEGNHERDWPDTDDRFQNQATDSGGECGVPTWLRYQMPTATPLREGNYWYSYDHGPIHFLAYSTERDYAPGSPQYNFIQSDLASVNRSQTPWVIANLHRPIYTTSIAGVSQSSDLQGGADQRAAFEDLFFTYQVDLTLCGHVHLYERTCRGIYQKTCLPDHADGSAAGPMHVTLGNGGQWLSYFVNPDTPDFFEALAIEHGYMKMTVNQTTLSAQMMSAIDDHLIDAFELHKPVGWQSNATAQAAILSTFEPNVTLLENWVDEYGVDGGLTTAITTLVLDLLAANPSSYEYIQNATLVQNLNALDTLANSLEVLNPVIKLIYDPTVYESTKLTTEEKTVITEVLQPLFVMLNNTQSGELMGTNASATATL